MKPILDSGQVSSPICLFKLGLLSSYTDDGFKVMRMGIPSTVIQDIKRTVQRSYR